MMKRSTQCRPVERVAHRLKGDLGAELTKVASEQMVNKVPHGRQAIRVVPVRNKMRDKCRW